MEARLAAAAAPPAACRSFPRIVTATPEGIEVAFDLACPTAARLVATAPGGFAWTDRPLDGLWPYPPTRRVPGRLIWSGDATMGLADLDGLRTGWWARLARAAVDPDALLRALAALAVAPDDPAADGAPDALAHGLAPSAASALAGAAVRLPGAPALPVDALAAALSRPRTVTSLMAPWPGPAAGAVCMAVQRAGMHDGRAVAEGLRSAAREGALCLGIAADLEAASWGTPQSIGASAVALAAVAARRLGVAGAGARGIDGG